MDAFGPSQEIGVEGRCDGPDPPRLLLTTQAITSMGALVGADLDSRRFRPNLPVDVGDGAIFPEDAWVGAALRISGLRMRIDKPDQRCVVITMDPVTGERDPAILAALAREHHACAGVYGSTVEPGRIAVGGPVLLEE